MFNILSQITLKVKFLRNEEHCLLPSLVDNFTCVHSKNALLTHILSPLFRSTSVIFSCTPFGTKSYLYIYIYIYIYICAIIWWWKTCKQHTSMFTFLSIVIVCINNDNQLLKMYYSKIKCCIIYYQDKHVWALFFLAATNHSLTSKWRTIIFNIILISLNCVYHSLNSWCTGACTCIHTHTHARTRTHTHREIAHTYIMLRHKIFDLFQAHQQSQRMEKVL